MDVIDEILSEDEARDMPEETLYALYRVLNVNMKNDISKYLEDPHADQQVVAKISALLGDDVQRSVFHLRVKDQGIQDLIRRGALDRLPDMLDSGEIDVDVFIEKLKWLESREDNLTSLIGVRGKDDYEIALRLITEYDRNPEYAHIYPLSDTLKAFKGILFLPAHEKNKSSGMDHLIAAKRYWKMQLKGAEYWKYCRDHGISRSVAREV